MRSSDLGLVRSGPTLTDEGATMNPKPAVPCANRAVARRHAVLYARVSSKDQEKEGFSIPAQEKLLRSYALANHLTVQHEFVDVETAKQAGRAGFGKMITFFRQHRETCRVLLVEKTDRLY